MKSDGNKTKSQKETLKRVIGLIAPYKFYVFCTIICAAATTVFQLLIPILCGDAIDAMIGAGRVEFGIVRSLLVKVGICAACAALAQWILGLCSNKTAFGVSRDIRNAAIEKIEKMPFSRLDRLSSGDLMSRISADTDLFSDGLLMGFTQLFTGVITIFGTLFFMLRVKAAIGLVVICVTPLSMIAASFIAKRSFRYFHKTSEVRGAQTAHVTECVEGMKVIQAFGREEKVLKDFDEINTELRDISFRSVFYSSITNPTTRFVNSLVYAGAGLTGALFAIAGSLSVGQLSIFLSYANQYAKPFNEISGVVTEMQNSLACAARLFELLDEAEEEPDAADASVLLKEKTDGSMELENVCFGYTPEKTLIRDFNLHVTPGMRVALVGPTGCGKTTLINLLMRFYEIGSGKISVSGTDTKKITRDSLRGAFGMVLQDTWLMNRSVADNIAYGRPSASREEITAAAKAAHAHSFIRRMPQGYDTIIEGDGGNLSEGQKQLLCIARVMLTLPPMLILDEATSSIDTRTELKIQKAFDMMMQGRTSFVVAHRLSTIREADVILVMKDGSVVEQGTHEELLSKGGFYEHLYNAQFAGNAI